MKLPCLAVAGVAVAVMVVTTMIVLPKPPILRVDSGAGLAVRGVASGDLLQTTPTPTSEAPLGRHRPIHEPEAALGRFGAAVGRLEEALERLGREGTSVARSLAAAQEGAPSWAAIHAVELERAASQLEASRTLLSGLAQQAAAASASGLEGERRPELGSHDDVTPNDYFTSLSDSLGPFILISLVFVTLALARGRKPFDLFSADVHSQLESALAFTLASLTAIGLVNSRLISAAGNNPICLYVWELVSCFLAVSSTMPMLMGTSSTSPRSAALASPLAVVWFGGLWMSSDTPVLWCFIHPMTFFEHDPLFVGPAVVLSLLYLALLFMNGCKVANALGAKGRIFQPFYKIWAQRCRAYVSARLRGAASLEVPVALPAAVLVAVIGVAATLSTAITEFAFLGWTRYNQLRSLAIALLRPADWFFRWAGHPLDLNYVEFAMTRVLISFYVALLLAVLYSAWLLRTVLLGYKRMFRDIATGKRYHGQELAESSPAVFHAQWASYFAGALMGNALMAVVVIMAVVWPLMLVLLMPQFWQTLWSMRTWWILYGLLYTTRKCIFIFVIPRYVITDSGIVLRRRLWAMIFPTLLLLNLVLGATSGIVRFAVLFPYLLCQFFRVDVTFLPGSICDWDWSYQPFVCLVTHAHRRLNPILSAMVSALGEAAAATGHPAPCTPLAAAVAAVTAPPAEVQRARSAPAAGGDGSRARQRWHLALTLAQNPALRSLRRRGTQGSAASAPGRMEGPRELSVTGWPTSGSAMALQIDQGGACSPDCRLPTLPSQRLESTLSFYSPLNAGSRTPLLQGGKQFGPAEASAEPSASEETQAAEQG